MTFNDFNNFQNIAFLNFECPQLVVLATPPFYTNFLYIYINIIMLKSCPAITKRIFFAASPTYIYLSFKNSRDSGNRAARLLENKAIPSLQIILTPSDNGRRRH